MGEYAVIGLGRFGTALVHELQRLGNEVMAIDRDRQVIQEISTTVRHAVEADATSEATLRELGLADVDAVIVATGSTEASIMITLQLKKVGATYVLAKASNDVHGEILRRVGADRVVFPEKETAVRLAHGIAVPEMFDYLSITRDSGIAKLTLPRHLVGLNFTEAQLEERFKVRVIAIIRKDYVIFGASLGERFEADDILVVSGRDSDLRELSRYAARED